MSAAPRAYGGAGDGEIRDAAEWRVLARAAAGHAAMVGMDEHANNLPDVRQHTELALDSSLRDLETVF